MASSNGPREAVVAPNLQLAPLQASTVSAILILYTLIYVLPLYVLPISRPSPKLSRDHPRAIRARVTSVLFSTASCCFLTYLVLSRLPKGSLPGSPLHVMGYWPIGFTESAACLFLTAILFAAPIYEALLLNGLWEDWRTLDPLIRVWTEWTSWRNIIMGPLTEEMLFRSASIPLLLCARMSLVQTIFLSPLVFGLAHVHHFYEFRITHPRVSLAAAVARSVFQVVYTTLFGVYATFLFLRSGSLLAIVLVHAFCNSIGLPRFWGSVEPYWHSRGQHEQGGRRKWTVLYYALLLSGATCWWRALLPLTESSATLVQGRF
ncbi:putative CAAX prenyl protease 2 [Colletotrichum sidae]|uniref:intramembrane prenyl-peptidase Rce1 n=1 Tax=Colletotrichum sidae TaxID=1347389 RepID=A0A4R8T299_9PEZI|nr:putative CAAX prenyl protease 2 [Colletotrichum sidae]